MKPRCSWGELILIQPIKVSNNKSFPQRKTCTEDGGSTVQMTELVFFKAQAQAVISVYCFMVCGNACPLVHVRRGQERNKHKDRGGERDREQPIVFQIEWNIQWTATLQPKPHCEGGEKRAAPLIL